MSLSHLARFQRALPQVSKTLTEAIRASFTGCKDALMIPSSHRLNAAITLRHRPLFADLMIRSSGYHLFQNYQSELTNPATCDFDVKALDRIIHERLDTDRRCNSAADVDVGLCRQAEIWSEYYHAKNPEYDWQYCRLYPRIWYSYIDGSTSNHKRWRTTMALTIMRSITVHCLRRDPAQCPHLSSSPCIWCIERCKR